MTLEQALIHAYENAPQYHAILGAVIGGISSVAGAALSSRKQKTTSEVDYVKMAKNAEAAGFNPLTAIRNGGSQGFTTTTTSGGASALGQALQALGGPLGEAMEKKLDPVEQKRRQLDTALVDYQLRQLREGPKAMPGQLYPGAQTIGTKVVNAKPSMSTKPNGLGEGTLVGGDDPKVSGMGWNNGKYGWFHNPWMPDAETAETIYGDNEILSTLYGAGKLAVDGAYSVYRNGRQVWKDAEARDHARMRKLRQAREGKAYTVIPPRRPPPPGYQYAP